MVQTSSTAIGVDEFMGLYRVCRLNHLVIFGTYLSGLVRAARTNDSVKVALQSLYQIGYTGTSMNKEDEDWAHANDIKIVVSRQNHCFQQSSHRHARRRTQAQKQVYRLLRRRSPAAVFDARPYTVQVLYFDHDVEQICPPVSYARYLEQIQNSSLMATTNRMAKEICTRSSYPTAETTALHRHLSQAMGTTTQAISCKRSTMGTCTAVV